MLTVYNPGRHICDELQGCYYKNFLPFDIEKHDWKLVTEIHDAEFIVLHGNLMVRQNELYEKIEQIKNLKLDPDQKLIITHITHLDQLFADRMYFLFMRKVIEQELPNKFAIVHTNFALKNEIQYDFLWNRQKIYFTNYNYINLKERLYVPKADIKNWELNPIYKSTDKIYNQLRKFLCPNRIYSEYDHPRLEYRKKLGQFLKNYEHDGHISDPANNKILHAENPIVDDFLDRGGWYPVANHYYQGTFFSIFVETVTGNLDADHPYKSITEKTWDPLIKGHFILPFGYRGLIDHIKSYGFKLPEWIDYSYDYIEDDDLRFEAFLNSAEKILKLSISDWTSLYEKDKHLLEHNREVFWTRPYDSLHDKVVDFFQIGK